MRNHAGATVLRLSSLDLRADNDLSSRYIETGMEFFENNHVAIKIERGATLIWDNWRVLHSRNAFADRNRHLRRVLIGAPDG